MVRKKLTTDRAIDRYQVTFSYELRDEGEFLRDWFAMPWGRRQAWLRGLLALGMKCIDAGCARDRQFVGVDIGCASVKTHPVSISLRRQVPAEGVLMVALESLPVSRRSGWLRDAVLLGVWVNQQIPFLLTNVSNQGLGQLPGRGGGQLAEVATDERLISEIAPVIPQSKENRKITPVKAPVQQKSDAVLRENGPNAIYGAQNTSGLTKNDEAAAKANLSLDIDLSIFERDGSDDVAVKKLAGLNSLFN